MEIQRVQGEYVLQMPFAALDAAVERHTRGWHVWRITVTRTQLTAGSAMYALSNPALGHIGNITVWAGADGKLSTWQPSSTHVASLPAQREENQQREKQMTQLAAILAGWIERDAVESERLLVEAGCLA